MDNVFMKSGHTVIAKLPDNLLQCLVQFIFVDRFQNIIAYPIGYSRLCVFKMCISADNNNFKIRTKLSGLPDQFQSVAARHTNVCDQDIRMKLFDQGKRLKSVLCPACDLHVQTVPVHQRFHEPAY